MPITRIAAVALVSTTLVAGVASAAVAGHGPGDGSTAPGGARATTPGHASGHVSGNVSGKVSADVAVTKGHTLKSTYFAQGSRGGETVAAGFQTVDDPITVKCTKTCYVDGDEVVQQASTVSGNSFALSIRVDGVDQSAPYAGTAPTSFGLTSSHTVSAPLKPGTHTVQTVIYTAQGTALYNYSNVYHLYQP